MLDHVRAKQDSMAFSASIAVSFSICLTVRWYGAAWSAKLIMAFDDGRLVSMLNGN